MNTLTSGIIKLFKQYYTAPLQKELADAFDLDAKEVSEFFEGFDKRQFGNIKTKAARPKGRNGKGRVSGYITYCNSIRDETRNNNPELTNKELMAELAKQWNSLTDDDKAEWNERASQINTDNGL